MSSVKQVHREAMEHRDLAISAKFNGDEENMRAHLRRAYELEASAADMLLANFEAEPSRSVLYRSAATLAHECGMIEEAEHLIHKGLAGKPSAIIADELRDLLEQVNFQRHLKLRDVELSNDEVQMSLTGNSVGFGMVSTDVFLKRMEDTEVLLFRTAERTRRMPFRKTGRRSAKLSQEMEFYVSAPRAACFAITFRVGGIEGGYLPGMEPGQAVIDELLACLELYAARDNKGLRERIPDDAYYVNFLALAGKIQPDGSKVKTVGFTAKRGSGTKEVALRQASGDTMVPLIDASEEGESETVEVRGFLMKADATKERIEIISSGSVRHVVIVPEGMMVDIVKPLWESEVMMRGTRKDGKLHLIQISEAPERFE